MFMFYWSDTVDTVDFEWWMTPWYVSVCLPCRRSSWWETLMELTPSMLMTSSSVSMLSCFVWCTLARLPCMRWAPLKEWMFNKCIFYISWLEESMKDQKWLFYGLMMLDTVSSLCLFQTKSGFCLCLSLLSEECEAGRRMLCFPSLFRRVVCYVQPLD